VERFLASDRVRNSPPLFEQDELRRRIMLTLNIGKIVQHLVSGIRAENSEALVPVFDTEHPIRSTGDMRPWFTRKPCEHRSRSHINQCMFDSTWEASEAYVLDREPRVQAWAKNDHLGFEVVYVFNGVVRKYRPDFLVRLTNGDMLVLEVKGQDSAEHQAKRQALDEWVRAVNMHGGFGAWAWDVSRDPADVSAILRKQAGDPSPVRLMGG
jgi:type III restriction enzyme